MPHSLSPRVISISGPWVDPMPSSPPEFPPQQYAAPSVVIPQLPLTDATLMARTVITAVSLELSRVAMIRVEPTLTPLTSPFVSTVAIAGLSLRQLTGYPETT